MICFALISGELYIHLPFIFPEDAVMVANTEKLPTGECSATILVLLNYQIRTIYTSICSTGPLLDRSEHLGDCFLSYKNKNVE